MNRSTHSFSRVFFFLLLTVGFSFSGYSQADPKADTTLQKVENYREQIRRLVGFLEFSLNTLGSPETSTKEKEIIINESYAKAFLNEKVQVEDDLDENREILTYKDIQAYLKDVDFFFKDAKFNITVQDIQALKNDAGMPYFKVTANRNLQAVTINDSLVSNNKTRYIEINVDEDEQVLKIASIYTTRLNEAQELMTWWNGMPMGWKNLLGHGFVVFEEIQLDQVDFLNDTTLLFIHEVPSEVEYESFVHIGNDSLLIIEKDTILVETYDTIYAGKNNGVRYLKEITKTESLDVSGNLYVYDLYPVDQMTDLRSLDVSGTLITDLFPARNLNRLEILDISRTGIDDLGPIQYNTKVKELRADSTAIRSLEPIKGFADLEILHLNHSGIDDISAIKFLSRIKDLRINGTAVSDLTPAGDLVSLENLCIAGTAISSLEPIQYLVTLKRLNIENTLITDLSPLSRLENLQVIDADKTGVSSLEPLASLPALEKVYCDHSGIDRTVANAFMAAHPSVLVIYESEALTTWWESLDAEWKGIFRSYVVMDESPTREQLHQLTLVSKVDIKGMESINDLGPLEKLTNLKELDAGKTMVSDLGPLSDLIELRVINCPETRVSSLEPLSALTNLEKLDVSNTPLTSLAGLENLDHLQVLTIDSTGVDNLGPVKGLTLLTVVYCDAAKIGRVESDSFLDVNNSCLVIYQTESLLAWWQVLPAPWKKAFRAHTQVDDQPSREQLSTLSSLDSLDLSGNREITSLAPLPTLHRLEKLSLANGVLQDLGPLRDLARLKHLILSGNPVMDLSPLSSLPGLKSLDISNTPVTKLDALSALTSLEYLNCSGTQIKKLDPLETLVKLRKLECYNTSINNLKPLTGLVQLRQLVCYNTNLSEKKVAAFKEQAPGLEVVFY